MKVVDVSCPSCGAKLTAPALGKMITCKYCGKTAFIDDEIERVNCQVDHHITAEDAEELGYQFEKGRQRAKEEMESEDIGSQWLPTYRPNVRPLPPAPPPDVPPHSENFGCGKMLLWIFFFPIMFWYWFFTTDKLSRTVKWILFLGLLAYVALTK